MDRLISLFDRAATDRRHGASEIEFVTDRIRE